MSITSGFKKYRNYRTDSNGDHQLQSFWTSTDTVHGTDQNQTPLTTTLENMNTPTFSEASTRANLAGSNESMTTILGKIKKYFTDLGTAAFKSTTNTYSSTGTDPITGTGVADALDSLGVAEVGGSGKYLTTISEANGKISATADTADTTVTQSSSKLVTSGAVWTAIDNLPEPMVFKGTLGTGGTITTLPTASSANEGYTYKVITAGTYETIAAKVGDVFVSNGTEWVHIPAGDTDSDTWRNIKVNGTELLGSAISTGAINFKNGTNTTVSGSSGEISVSVPAVSSSSAGVAPKGNAVSTQSQSTKFLREDGSWAAPSYTTDTNTTYAFAQGTNNGEIKITPSSGSATTVTPKGLSDLAYISKGSGSSKFLREDGSWQTVTSAVTGVKGDSESSYRTGNINITKANIGLGNVGNFKAVSTVASQGLSSTEQSNARANIGAGTSSFSGSYNDLSNKPTIPTVNNKTLTIQKNGTQVAQFTANSASDVTANITVPTGDLASINKDGTSSTKYLRGDGTWQAFPSIPAAQIQSDWNQTDTTKKDYIKNKPTIPTVPGVVSTSANGLAPKITNTSGFLRGDGTWSTPANNAVTVTNRKGSSYNNKYPVVFGTNTGTETATEGLGKRSGDFTYNPYTERLSVYQETVESALKVGVANTWTGYIDLYSSSQEYRGQFQITIDGLTADRNYYLPDETGTLATREYLNSNCLPYAPTSVTLTAASGTLNSYFCYKFGRLVILQFQITGNYSSGSAVKIINGAPKPSASIQFSGYWFGSSSDQAKRFSIDTTGSIYYHWNAAACNNSGPCVAQLAYYCA